MCAYILYSIKKLSWATVNDSGQQFHPFSFSTHSMTLWKAAYLAVTGQQYVHEEGPSFDLFTVYRRIINIF